MSIFYTSDSHFSHRNVIKYCDRPFESIDEMNKTIIDKWNQVVSKKDTVFHLGDVAMGKIAESLPLVGQLNGYKILVPGNHDRVFPRVFPSGKRGYNEHFLAEYFKYFNEVLSVDGVPRTILDSQKNEHRVFLSHFPYQDSAYKGKNRYENFCPVMSETPLLHGHVHGSWKTNGNQFNVGCDVNDFAPVEERVIGDWIAKEITMTQ